MKEVNTVIQINVSPGQVFTSLIGFAEWNPFIHKEGRRGSLRLETICGCISSFLEGGMEFHPKVLAAIRKNPTNCCRGAPVLAMIRLHK
jgi:hypothetical protein